jgi:hypothetical protein
LLLHALANRINDLPALDDVSMQPLAAQVEETVLKPYVLRIFLVPEHRHRQFTGRAQHLDSTDIELDRPGRQFRIVGAGGPPARLAVDPNHPFRAQLLGILERRRIRIDHALRQPVVVAQIDEQHPTVVADAMAPAGQTDRLADIALAKRAAGVGPVTMHGCPESASEEAGIMGFR